MCRNADHNWLRFFCWKCLCLFAFELIPDADKKDLSKAQDSMVYISILTNPLPLVKSIEYSVNVITVLN